MKNIFLILIISFLVFSCSTNTTSDSSDSLYKQWIQISENEHEGEKDNSIQFNKNEKVVTGFSGCNNFSGSYQVTGELMSFDKVISTKKYCPAIKQETTFLNLLNNVNSFKIVGGTLILYKDNLEILKFK